MLIVDRETLAKLVELDFVPVEEVRFICRVLILKAGAVIEVSESALPFPFSEFVAFNELFGAKDTYLPRVMIKIY